MRAIRTLLKPCGEWDIGQGDAVRDRKRSMKYLRNPDLQKELLGLGVIMAAAVAGVWKLSGVQAAMAVAAISLLFLLIFLWHSKRNYASMAALAEEIDRVLHGEYISILENCKEGDLPILSAQIQKMLRRFKEQQGILEKEKLFLADAMADISHQMKTPLTSIHLILSFLQEEELPYEKRMEYVKELTVLTSRIDWMVYALLRMAKLDAGTVELQQNPYDAALLVKKSYESLAVSMDICGITFQSEIDVEHRLVGDIAWMAEAVTNILKNCMEHTPEGGEIVLRIQETALYFLVEIRDNGKGISQEDLPHVFERFYRGKDADENSVGIGLALAKQIIISQHGTIQVRNRKEGTGAVFSIRLYKGTV